MSERVVARESVGAIAIRTCAWRRQVRECGAIGAESGNEALASRLLRQQQRAAKQRSHVRQHALALAVRRALLRNLLCLAAAFSSGDGGRRLSELRADLLRNRLRHRVHEALVKGLRRWNGRTLRVSRGS